VLYPSAVYWKLGHFSAIVAEQEDRFLVEDTTFADQIWMTRAALDEEASGYFLVPAGPLPQGWQSVTREEGEKIWGRMTPNTRDPNRTTPDDDKWPCPPNGTHGM